MFHRQTTNKKNSNHNFTSIIYSVICQIPAWEDESETRVNKIENSYEEACEVLRCCTPRTAACHRKANSSGVFHINVFKIATSATKK